MITVFERIPDLFLQIYDESLQVWAREFKTRGPKQAVQFLPVPGSIPILGPDGKPVLRGAWLVAEVDRSLGEPRVIIKPETDRDAEAIDRHVREMARHVLH